MWRGAKVPAASSPRHYFGGWRLGGPAKSFRENGRGEPSPVEKPFRQPARQLRPCRPQTGHLQDVSMRRWGTGGRGMDHPWVGVLCQIGRLSSFKVVTATRKDRSSWRTPLPTLRAGVSASTPFMRLYVCRCHRVDHAGTIGMNGSE